MTHTSEDTPSALHWREVDPIDSPLLIGSVQLRRYRLFYGDYDRNLEIVLWHHDVDIQNVFIPEYDKESYTVELIAVLTNEKYNYLISRSDTDSLKEANFFVSLYQTLCTTGLESIAGE